MMIEFHHETGVNPSKMESETKKKQCKRYYLHYCFAMDRTIILQKALIQLMENIQLFTGFYTIHRQYLTGCI